MTNFNFNLTQILVTLLTFPTLYQAELWRFIYSPESQPVYTYLKRLILLLPGASAIVVSWLLVVGIVSLIFRPKKIKFISQMVVALWDFGRSILLYWLGLLQFVFTVLGTIGSSLRILFLWIYKYIVDVLRLPGHASRSVMGVFKRRGIPWPAVILTLIWAILETSIFTYVMTPLVNDVLGGLTGEPVSQGLLQVGLFLVFFLLVLGSYAVISQFKKAIAEKAWGTVFGLITIEIIVALVEVVFFYREFVDALIPWFAQYAGADFNPGIPMIMSIAFLAWLGIRAMTWFLFASEGIPTLLAVIQRSGMEDNGLTAQSAKGSNGNGKGKGDGKGSAAMEPMEDLWTTDKTDQLIDAFILPPLQILASVINLATLVLGQYFLFDLPLKSHKDLANSRRLLDLIDQADSQQPS